MDGIAAGAAGAACAAGTVGAAGAAGGMGGFAFTMVLHHPHSSQIGNVWGRPLSEV